MLGNLQSQFPDHKQGWVNLPVVILSSLILVVSLPAVKAQIFETSNQSPISISQNDSDVSTLTIQENTLRPIIEPVIERKPKKILKSVIITGYSSTVCQTDSTPFITANGSLVKDGIVASNLLPFGTRIRIPEIYDDRVFTVEDRMHFRNSYNVDIWFDSYWQAKSFGVIRTDIEVLD